MAPAIPRPQSFDGQWVYLVKLGEQNDIMPTAVYIDREFSASVGQQAIADYIAGNQGRKVELSAEVLGEARTSTGTDGSWYEPANRSQYQLSLWPVFPRLVYARTIISRALNVYWEVRAMSG